MFTNIFSTFSEGFNWVSSTQNNWIFSGIGVWLITTLAGAIARLFLTKKQHNEANFPGQRSQETTANNGINPILQTLVVISTFVSTTTLLTIFAVLILYFVKQIAEDFPIRLSDPTNTPSAIAPATETEFTATLSPVPKESPFVTPIITPSTFAPSLTKEPPVLLLPTSTATLTAPSPSPTSTATKEPSVMVPPKPTFTPTATPPLPSPPVNPCLEPLDKIITTSGTLSSGASQGCFLNLWNQGAQVTLLFEPRVDGPVLLEIYDQSRLFAPVAKMDAPTPIFDGSRLLQRMNWDGGEMGLSYYVKIANYASQEIKYCLVYRFVDEWVCLLD